ncbi:hypothetical protein MTO96_039162 [Rhipicephalus appendiculatus]
MYRAPYEVKKRQWERKIMLQQQRLQKQEAEETAESNPRGRSKERHGNEDFRARNDSFPRLEETTEGQQQRGQWSSCTGGALWIQTQGENELQRPGAPGAQASGARAGTKTV